jgi:hypothetical protein
MNTFEIKLVLWFYGHDYGEFFQAELRGSR